MLLALILNSAYAVDRTEFTCSLHCRVVIGNEKGPKTAIRLTAPLLDEFPEFTVAMNERESFISTELRFHKKARPVWIEDGVGGEKDRAWYGLVQGPPFAEIDTIDMKGERVRIHASDGEKWSFVLWHPITGEMFFEQDLLSLEPKFPLPTTHPLKRDR